MASEEQLDIGLVITYQKEFNMSKWESNRLDILHSRWCPSGVSIGPNAVQFLYK